DLPTISAVYCAIIGDKINAGIAIKITSNTSCINILPLEIPNDNNIAISFLLAFIHKNNSNDTIIPANMSAPINNVFAILLILSIDCSSAGKFDVLLTKLYIFQLISSFSRSLMTYSKLVFP